MVQIGVFAQQLVGLVQYQLAISVIAPHIVAHLTDNRQDPRLAIVVSVCSNAQVHLVLVRVSAVCCHHPEHRVFWCLWDDIRAERRGVTRAIDGAHLVVQLLESLVRLLSVWLHARHCSSVRNRHLEHRPPVCTCTERARESLFAPAVLGEEVKDKANEGDVKLQRLPYVRFKDMCHLAAKLSRSVHRRRNGT